MQNAAWALVACATVAPAQEWSRFRGVGGQGVAEGVELPALGAEHERWRTAVGGTGHSSPVLWDEVVYLLRVVGEGRREVVAFDAGTGEQSWARGFDYEPHPQHRFNSAASSTPVVDASGVYVVWTSGTSVEALALGLDGSPRWTKTVGAFRAQHGSAHAPVLVGGVLVFGNEHEDDGSFLIGLAAESGEERWRIARRSAPRRGSYAAPVPYRCGDETLLLFASTAHGLAAVEPEQGVVRWELDLGLEQRCVAVPAVSGSIALVCAGAGGGGKEALAVRLPQSAEDEPRIQYRLRRNLSYVPSCLVTGRGVLMISDGGVASLRGEQDGKAVWRQRLDGAFFSSPVRAADRIFVGSREGELLSLAVGDGLVIESRLDLGAPIFATPAIARDALYVRTAEHLICLGAAPSDR